MRAEFSRVTSPGWPRLHIAGRRRRDELQRDGHHVGRHPPTVEGPPQEGGPPDGLRGGDCQGQVRGGDGVAGE